MESRFVIEGSSESLLERPANISSNQWSLAGILWLSTALALLLGYAIRLGQEAVWQALAYSLFVLAIGLTILLQWFERESRQPRFVLASWLAISVLIGNLLVPILGGVQR